MNDDASSDACDGGGDDYGDGAYDDGNPTITPYPQHTIIINVDFTTIIVIRTFKNLKLRTFIIKKFRVIIIIVVVLLNFMLICFSFSFFSSSFCPHFINFRVILIIIIGLLGVGLAIIFI